jgi:hypothetical protein
LETQFTRRPTFIEADLYSARRAFASTPASFSSALIKAEAFSCPKPSATADLKTFRTARLLMFSREHEPWFHHHRMF